jgi:hypothetical protein
MRTPAEGGDYFERLDQAFANLSGGPDSERLSAPSATALDWFASQPPPVASAQPPFAPTPSGPHDSAQAVAAAPPSGPHDRWDVTGSPTGPPSVNPHSYAPAPPPPPLPALPPLADAFAALLAAEQASPTPRSSPLWPSLPHPPSPAITDEVIERITRRVMDQLTDRVLSEAVEEKVSLIAERLIREEIERIKKSIT